MPSSTVLVVDSSIIIDLYKADVLDKALLLPYQIEVADLIWNEIVYPEQTELESLGLTPMVFSEDEIDEIASMQSSLRGLSVPDCSNIVLAKKFLQKQRGGILGVQDSALFKAATRLGISCKDGLDLLDEMVELKILDAAQARNCFPFLGRGRPEIVLGKTTMLIEKWHKKA